MIITVYIERKLTLTIIDKRKLKLYIFPLDTLKAKFFSLQSVGQNCDHILYLLAKFNRIYMSRQIFDRALYDFWLDSKIAFVLDKT